jgi:hypothetical protein
VVVARTLPNVESLLCRESERVLSLGSTIDQSLGEMFTGGNTECRSGMLGTNDASRRGTRNVVRLLFWGRTESLAHCFEGVLLSATRCSNAPRSVPMICRGDRDERMIVPGWKEQHA